MASSLSASLINGDFSTPVIGGPESFIEQHDGGNIKFYNAAAVPGWTTTDRAIEIWRDGALGFSAPAGFSQWAEVNAYLPGTLSQTVSINAGSQYGFAFYHRGRTSASVADVINVKITHVGSNTVVHNQDYSDTNSAWGFHVINLGIAAGGNYLLEFQAVSTASADTSFGNFLTAIQLEEGVGQVPEPASVGMMIFGAGFIAVAARRRKA